MQKIHEHQLDFAIIALPYETQGLLVKELYGDEFWLTAKPDDQALTGKTVTSKSKRQEREWRVLGDLA